jgi:hypothetical protein
MLSSSSASFSVWAAMFMDGRAAAVALRRARRKQSLQALLRRAGSAL